MIFPFVYSQCCLSLKIIDHYCRLQRNPRIRTQTITAYTGYKGSIWYYGKSDLAINFEVVPSRGVEHMEFKTCSRIFQHDNQNISWLCYVMIYKSSRAQNMSHLTQSHWLHSAQSVQPDRLCEIVIRPILKIHR